MTQEEIRLQQSQERTNHWKRWGPYLSERAWGTVREDYSQNGDAWEYFPHEHARSRAYRWNEDGIAGICDRHQLICFSVAMWNEHDHILKERLFGLAGPQGNHGEDVKEHYFYLDNTPTHSYMKYLYKYPQAAFPYEKLVDENRRRGKDDAEYELADTGVFNENRYFDVVVEYAKATHEDILVRITAANRGPDPARLYLLPTLWFRNIWAWTPGAVKPALYKGSNDLLCEVVHIEHPEYSTRYLYCDQKPALLFTDNETNKRLLFNAQGPLFCKDGINEYIVNGHVDRVKSDAGTKVAADYRFTLAPGESVSVKLRLTDQYAPESCDPFGPEFDQIFQQRLAEADEFYANVIPEELSDDAKNVMRQGFAGMLWSKQFYHYILRDWLHGDPTEPPPPQQRRNGRNKEWPHLYNSDVISMPDKWEYPWYAAWDLAFHCVPLALIDAEFAKEQLMLLLREWYMHPNGQLPAYEWSFSDVNPPVHAWAAWRVYKIDKKRSGKADRAFLVRIFHKLLLNFTWWVNRKDADGMNIFQGGFLGMDNIGIFDRSQALPTGGYLEQSDGTSWMAMYTLNLLAMAFELAKDDPAYEDVASKFWEHFIYIAHAMNNRNEGVGLWDEEDGFFYDVLRLPDGSEHPMRVRSMVGLIPLFAVETLEPEVLDRLPGFKRRLEWFIDNRPDLTENVACMRTAGQKERRLLSIVGGDQLRQVLKLMLAEQEFLSPYGIRSLSRFHHDHPYRLSVGGMEYRVDYEPAESRTGIFGGNSNWRGPIWFPVNFLLVESLQKFHHYLGNDFKVEFPTGSGNMLSLWEVAGELSRRLSQLFLQDANGQRAVHFGDTKFRDDPNWRDLVLFYEYFDGDTGRGLGASHQTGWTGLVTKMLQQSGESNKRDEPETASMAFAD
jgi:hypothetical protein